jgi:hypothetical protein
MTYDDTNPTFEAFVHTFKTDCEVCGGMPGFVALANDDVLEVLCEAECDEDKAQCPLLSYQAFYPEAFFLTGSTGGSKDAGSSSTGE